MTRADITVRGAGVWGLAIAWELAQRGARVQVVDPAPGSGASAGLVGALSPYAPAGWNAVKAFQRDSLLAAAGFWAGVEAASGLSTGYARTGRLVPVTDLPRALAQGEAAARHWAPHAAWAVTASPDWLAPGGPVVHDTLAARLNPRETLAALTAALRGAGVKVAPEGSGAGTVIHATGVTGLEAAGLGRGVKGQALLLAHAAPDRPQVFADGLHIVPHADGTTAVGSTSEIAWDDPTATDAQLDALRARAVALVPELAGAPVVARWAALRPRADTRQPVLGPWPGRPGHILANGAFKIGFGLAPGVARVIADLALTGRADIPGAFLPSSSPKYPGG